MFEKGRFSSLPHQSQARGMTVVNHEASFVNPSDTNFPSFERPDPDNDQPEPPTQTGFSQDQHSSRNAELEHERESLRDCLLKCSFCHSEFDSGNFLVMAQTMMDKVFSDSDDKTRNSVKADIISSLAIKLSTLLSLSKTQNEQTLDYWKTMMVFANPESKSIVKNVHASYSTRVRQSLRSQCDMKS